MQLLEALAGDARHRPNLVAEGPVEGELDLPIEPAKLGSAILTGPYVESFQDLFSQHIWRPMGAESDAYITVDRIGSPRAAGGCRRSSPEGREWA